MRRAPGRGKRGGGRDSPVRAAPGHRSEPASAGTGTTVPLGAAASPSARLCDVDDGDLDRRLDAALIGGRERREIVLADPDPAWADRFALERARIADALGDRALRIEHIGSTSVPGLAAKPI